MAKLFIEETTLSSIGDAIRSKAGTNELISPLDMPNAIINLPSGGDIEVEPIVIEGYQTKPFSGALPSQYIKLFGNTVSTKNLTNAQDMFDNYKNETIPFSINFQQGYDGYGSGVSIEGMFRYCEKLKQLPVITGKPKIKGFYEVFRSCNHLKEITEEFVDSFDYSLFESKKCNCGFTFVFCYSLRWNKALEKLMSNCSPTIGYSNSWYYQAFYSCSSLDEVKLPTNYTTVWTSNAFISSFEGCYRLKNVIFDMPNGVPAVTTWKAQTIDLSTAGFCPISYSQLNTGTILNYNSGITADKLVNDDATYQALKDDPDWFSGIDYSRYNRTSAINTINSLPDTSAYLASAGGTNTIKFKGAAGALTDGGAINTMTEEEIAVAAAKGWTVTFV